ncbi:MAG: hypothetical protein ACPG6P_09625, partial [Akkermansiaceae bacterium]
AQSICADTHGGFDFITDHHHSTQSNEPANPLNNTPSDHPSDEHEDEAPCQLCLILSTDSMQSVAPIDIPAPVVSDYLPLHHELSLRLKVLTDLNFEITPRSTDRVDHADSSIGRILCGCVTVRGPNTL